MGLSSGFISAHITEWKSDLVRRFRLTERSGLAASFIMQPWKMRHSFSEAANSCHARIQREFVRWMSHRQL